VVVVGDCVVVLGTGDVVVGSAVVVSGSCVVVHHVVVLGANVVAGLFPFPLIVMVVFLSRPVLKSLQYFFPWISR